MKKLTVAMVLTLALVMTGCMGGGLSKNQDAEIRLTLDAYIENFKKLDSKAMAQLYTYPATIHVVYDRAYTLSTPHQGEYFYEKMWGFDRLRTWYNIEDVKMTILSINSGDMATVKAVLSVTATDKGFPNEVYNLKTEHEFVMRKVGSTWKIAWEKIFPWKDTSTKKTLCVGGAPSHPLTADKKGVSSMREGVVIPFLPYLWVKLKLLMESNSGLYYAMRDQEYKVYQLMNSKEKTLAQKILDRKRREREKRQRNSRGRRQ